MDRIRLGKHSYCDATIHRWPGQDSRLIVGNYCSIAAGSHVLLGGEHRHNWLTTFPFTSERFHANFPEADTLLDSSTFTNGDVVIENDVWVGYGAIILSGSRVCNGAIVGAGAVVRGTVHPYTVVVGNPARVKHYRFDWPTVRRLLESEWWNWPDDRVRRNLHILCAPPNYPAPIEFLS